MLAHGVLAEQIENPGGPAENCPQKIILAPYLPGKSVDRLRWKALITGNNEGRIKLICKVEYFGHNCM